MIIKNHSAWAIERLMDVALISTSIALFSAEIEVVHPASLHLNCFEWFPNEILQEIEV